MLNKRVDLWDAHRRARLLMEPLPIWLLTLVAVALVTAVPVLAQNIDAPEAQRGKIIGTVTDVNDNTVPGAIVVLQGPVASDRGTVVTSDNGAFEFHDVKSGIPYLLDYLRMVEKGHTQYTLSAAFALHNHFAPGLRQTIQPNAPIHRFSDTHNVVSISTLVILIAADGATTQHLIQDYHFRELDPIVRPLVTRGNGGQAAACAMGLVAAVGTSYLFHQSGRHRFEKWTLRTFIAGESAAVINNVVRTP